MAETSDQLQHEALHVADQLGLEKRSIEYIPPTERHGRPNTLLTFWGASTITLVAAVTGGLAVTLGLSLPWAIATIVIGNLIGGLFMAYHSVQGPRLGMPQMIQSRAQFGFYGAILPLVVVVLMYVGYFVLGIVVGGQALAALTHLSFRPSMVIAAAIMLVLTWFGYDLFHRFNRISAILSTVLFIALTIRLLILLPSAHLASVHVAYGTVLLSISIFAAWQITYAPYVSDYSRYLPEDTPAKRTFWYTYTGSVAGSIWAMCLGAIATAIATSAFGANSAGYLAGLLSGAKYLVLLVLLVGVLASNYENPYGAFLTAVTTMSPSGRFAPGAAQRVIFTTVITVVSTIVAFLATSHFLTNLTNFLVYTLMALVPWTAINLTDYYLIRRGHYSIDEFFKIDGAYGKLNWLAVGIFLFTALIEIPFIDTAYYVGPIASRLGGGDISWIVGLVVASSLYYFLAPRLARSRSAGERPATA
jgi:nucleobase:cation symporter-1, NCS1 family